MSETTETASATATSTPQAPTATATAIIPISGTNGGINTIIIYALVYTLAWLVFAETMLGLASWWHLPADGSGLNSVHEVLKSTISFILGNLSAVVQAKVIGGGTQH